MRATNTISIFLASPGDVGPEREAARAVADELNLTAARSHGLVLQVVGWETDTRPAYGSDAQEIVNRQIANMGEHDLFVGIMWNRFGQATPRAESGTEEEFMRAVQSFERSGQPEIMFYFKEAESKLDTEEALDQRKKVLRFKSQVQKGGLTGTFKSTDEFRDKFRQDLLRIISSLGVKTPEPPPAFEATSALPSAQRAGESRTAAVPAMSEDVQWVLLSDHFLQASSVSEQSERQVVLRVIPSGPEDDAAIRSLRPDRFRRGEPVGYAYGNEGGFATVESAELESKGNRSEWTVTLNVVEDRSGGPLGEMAYNDVSADQIAELRARLILLDEKPAVGPGIGDKMLLSFVQGYSDGLKVSEGIFPELWRRFGSHDNGFVPLARLWAVFFLKASNTCEHILQLDLGPVTGKSLPVSFRGRRRRAFSNAEPTVIKVVGKCDLEPDSRNV